MSIKFRPARCYYCTGSFNHDDPTSDRYPTKDHRKPRARGGGNGRNLVWACRECNNEKSDMTETEFIAYREVTMGLVHRTARILEWRRYKQRTGMFASQH